MDLVHIHRKLQESAKVLEARRPGPLVDEIIAPPDGRGWRRQSGASVPDSAECGRQPREERRAAEQVPR